MAIRPVKATSLARFEYSVAELAKAETALRDIKNGVPRATAGATNKTLAKAKTAVIRGLTAYLTIQRANLLRRVYVRKAGQNGQQGFLKIMGREVSLANFAVKDTRKRGYLGEPKGSGVVGQIVRGTTVVFDGDFIAQGKFGNVQAFHRMTKARLPIEADYSSSLFKLFTRSPVKAQVEQLVADDLPKQLDSQIDRLLHIKR